jgi:hypothetical protein
VAIPLETAHAAQQAHLTVAVAVLLTTHTLVLLAKHPQHHLTPLLLQELLAVVLVVAVVLALALALELVEIIRLLLMATAVAVVAITLHGKLAVMVPRVLSIWLDSKGGKHGFICRS